ncbi:Coenzyme F420 hydrogenase/dehydrogenase, beta subunit C-terminal domain [Bifidobacterium callimiconis]|uniref:Coenzyme F420 hydrogenase/dehydrogenase, beta subunit C-terminal domain n=1 Tax=Bifidobacterium callimiconis TaxID=2306973 RepID=UPI001BDC4B74|nr:Coenzyme F420 hydrogenase/dehydrogenase, beta subunit C-terminal domain [Bifidobacterium callimiconis]MBT1177305.1 Coenzyme F420 hydrogenase/dehydrogenase, beta subunit C-terminal domain [Bifidobacterium callimiconis]
MGTVAQVIQGGYCIGCGVCPYVDSSLSMRMNSDGEYQAVEMSADHTDLASRVCPFANSDRNEDVIGRELFGSLPGVKHDDSLGYYLGSYVGCAKTGEFRSRGSSGGLVSWLAAKLLQTDEVDAVIHVKDSSEPGVMYSYQLSHSIDELESGAKSKYYPIELSHVLDYVKNHDERYAVIGIPCFIKALRLLEKEDPIINRRIRFHIGLVCGHLKSTFFSLAEAWESGIDPKNVERVDFRHKLPGRLTSDYAIKAEGTVDGQHVEVIKPVHELSTTDWGIGYFKYNACEYCDDVLAETADVTCGDAWLPGYGDDGEGMNVLVVRSAFFKSLLERFSDEIFLDEVPAETVAFSQHSGLRHRREGLSYRLHLKDKKGQWRPVKRVAPSTALSRSRKSVYKYRMRLVEESFKAFHDAERNGGGMPYFVRRMEPLVKAYRRADNPFLRRAFRKIKRMAKKVVRR